MKLGATTRIPASKCPTCGAPLSAATGLEGGRGPKPGDVTQCIRCAELLIFTNKLRLRKPTEKEFLDIQRSEIWPTIAAFSAILKTAPFHLEVKKQ